MMAYLLTHPEEFVNTTIPFYLCLMQTSGGLLAELTNLFMMATRQTSESCITFFVAFHVLNAIDNIYVEAFAELELLHASGEPLEFKKKLREIKFS